MGNIIWLMQAFLYAISCWSHIVVFATILQSGGVHRFGKLFSRWSNSIIYHECRPANKEELFNLWHTSACNVIEQIFTILKHCFRILVNPPEYDLGIQVKIPPLCTAQLYLLP
jgi:hypothetical protein